MKKKVCVAMSGGVDSSVAAALLKEAGYEVVGITMFLGFPAQFEAIKEVKRVADILKIKHYLLDLRQILEKKVIRNFCLAYLSGRTPNPCIVCNQHLKFGYLFKEAKRLGADFFASGHYARIVFEKNVFYLKKAKDLSKDQSYFLYRLQQRHLRKVIFPLGDYTKKEVKKIAQDFSLPVSEKKESQEICFLSSLDYRKFLKKRIGERILPGEILDKTGKVIGRHQGIAFYTIGQREGLGVALGYPAYVIQIDKKKNTITLGSYHDAFFKRCLVKNLSFINQAIKKKIVLKVKIRYNHHEATAEIIPQRDKKAIVSFTKPQFAITPGQSAVFYDKDKVVGGGIIEKILKE